MQAPNFHLYNVRTNTHVSLKDYEGKPLMLTFWVSWCPDCQMDLLQKSRFYQSLNENQLEFLSINVVGREHNPRDGLKFAETNELNFPILLDDGVETYQKYNCQGVPATFLIAANGQIFSSYGEKAPFVDMIQGISVLLDED